MEFAAGMSYPARDCASIEVWEKSGERADGGRTVREGLVEVAAGPLRHESRDPKS